MTDLDDLAALPTVSDTVQPGDLGVASHARGVAKLANKVRSLLTTSAGRTALFSSQEAKTTIGEVVLGATVAVATANPIAGSTLIQPTTGSDSRLRYSWSDAVQAGGGGGNAYWRGTHAGSASHPFVFDFMTDAPDFALDLIVKSNKAFIDVYVDGAPLFVAHQLDQTLESHVFPRIQKASGRAPSHVVVVARGVGVHGLRVTPIDSVWRPLEKIHGKLMVVIGDSFTASAEDVMGRPYWVDIALRFGFDVRVSGVSGSGYVNPTSAGSQRFIDRAATVIAWNPDLVLIVGSQNDTAYGGSAILAAANTLYAALAPTPVYVVGPMFWPGDTPEANESALQTAAASNANVKSYLSTLGWVTGTGAAAAGEQENDGTADVIRYAMDNKHPTTVGHRLLGRRMIDWLLPLVSVSTGGGSEPEPEPEPGFTATFDVADRNFLGMTDDGKAFQVINSVGGGWEIASGKARATGASSAQFAVVDALTADGTFDVALGALGTGTGSRVFGIVLRFQDADNHVVLMLRSSSTSFRYQLNKRIAGATSIAASGSISPSGLLSADADAVHIVLAGTSVTVTVNAVAAITATVAELGTVLAGKTKHGLYAALGTPASEVDSIVMVAA